MADEAPIKYPLAAHILAVHEFFVGFCTFGVGAILVLFLSEKLGYSQSDSTVIYHSYISYSSLLPIIGGLISDNWLGTFNVIFWSTIVLTVGELVLAFTSFDFLNIPHRPLVFVALGLIGIGVGCSQPCLLAFGGDQFVLPQQQTQMASFFSYYYVAINASAFLSMFLIPILRNDVHCFGSASCYPLAFIVTAAIMVIAFAVFALGKPFYKIRDSDTKKSDVLLNFAKCICYAIKHRGEPNPGTHWLDRSTEKYGEKLVTDVKGVFNVLVMFIPLPVFYSLYNQQSSGWTFQAAMMDGDCGGFTILPDQMTLSNAVFVLMLIPIFDYLLYPAFAKCHVLHKPLQKICCGGFLTAAAFIVSGLVAMALEKTYPILPSEGKAQLRIYDSTNCQYSYSTVGDLISGSEIKGGYHVDKSVKVAKEQMKLNFKFTSDSNHAHCKPREVELIVEEKKTYGIYINDDTEGTFVDKIEKSDNGRPLVRTIRSNDTFPVTYTPVKKGLSITIPPGNVDLKLVMQVGEYSIEGINAKVLLQLGGTYTILINQELKTAKKIVVTDPNNMHILWLLPQYFLISVAEVLWCITGFEFTYSEAPASMKAVLQAIWLLNATVGNMLIIFVEKVVNFKLQSNNFYAYGCLMTITMSLFTFLAIRYKSRKVEEEEEE